MKVALRIVATGKFASVDGPKDTIDDTSTFEVVFLDGLPPAPPPPGPPPAPPAAAAEVERIVRDTAAVHPELLRVFGSEAEAESAAEELLRRILWRLQRAAFLAGRQRNPSGLVSKDKLAVALAGVWHAYDIFSLGFAGRATIVQFLEIGGANPVPDPGLPD